MTSALLPDSCFSVLRGHAGPVQFAKWAGDARGRYALTGGQDRSIMLWNPYRAEDVDVVDASGASLSSSSAAASAAPPTALRIAEFRAHGHEVLEAAVAPGGERMASVGGDRCAFVWDVPSGAVLRKLFGHEQRLTSVALAPAGGGAVLVTGSDDKTVRLWDMRAPARAGALQVLADATDNVTRVLAGAADVVAASMDGHVRRYDLRSSRVLADDAGAPVVAAARSGDGLCLLAATLRAGGRLLLLEAAGGRRLKAYAGHANSLYRCTPAFSADDAHTLCGGEAGDVLFWDLVSAAPAHALRGAHARVVSWVEPHPDADAPAALLTASYDGTAKLWVVGGGARG